MAEAKPSKKHKTASAIAALHVRAKIERTQRSRARAPSSAASAAIAPRDESEAESDRSADPERIAIASSSDAEIEDISNGPGPAAALSAKQRKRLQVATLESYGRHFSKICLQYRFEPSPAEYMAWCVVFEALADEQNFLDVLGTDPEAAVEDVGIEEINKQRQKAVYHMILRCVPNPEVRTVVTTALTADKRTGFHAWQALREHFVGDKKAYMGSLETRFKEFAWRPDEEWPTCETRFTSLVAELIVAGVHKQPHQKRACLMEAIREANRKDAQGTPVFARLNTVNLIKEGSEFRQWLIAMRIEAQKIHDELSKKGSKRTREESESQEERKQELREVSFIGESASAPAPRNDPPRDTSAIPCRNFANFGQCKFGNTCKFSHNRNNSNSNLQQGRQIGQFRPPGGSNNRSVSNSNSNNNRDRSNSSNGSRGDNICFSWRDTGRCARTNCRFQHPAANSARPGAGTFGVRFTEAYSVSSSQQVGDHRIIADSGAEISITPRRDFFRRLLPLNKPILIRGAFGEPVVAKFYGDAFIPVDDGVYLVVPEMVLCESLRDTLLSMSQLLKRGHRIDINAAKGGGVFIDRSDEFTIPITLKDNIFAFDFQQHEVNVTTRARFRDQHQPAAAASNSREAIGAASSSSAASDSSS
jgi:hypothetical protein